MDSTLENTEHHAGVATTSSDVLAWTRILARYREPSRTRSVTELVITIVPLVLLWTLMWAALDLGYWVRSVVGGAGRGLAGAPVHDPA
jgi:fatty acid desaturase